MIVVSDNSPLQYLVLIDCIGVLPTLYNQILTTPEVITELRHPHTPLPVRNCADSPRTWVAVESPASIEFLDTLDIGEASAISLARERGAELLLIDERAGTQAARAVGLRAIGTLGVLIEARIEGFVNFDAAVGRLIAETPFYASKTLLEAARQILDQKRKERG